MGAGAEVESPPFPRGLTPPLPQAAGGGLPPRGLTPAPPPPQLRRGGGPLSPPCLSVSPSAALHHRLLPRPRCGLCSSRRVRGTDGPGCSPWPGPWGRGWDGRGGPRPGLPPGLHPLGPRLAVLWPSASVPIPGHFGLQSAPLVSLPRPHRCHDLHLSPRFDFSADSEARVSVLSPHS